MEWIKDSELNIIQYKELFTINKDSICAPNYLLLLLCWYKTQKPVYSSGSTKRKEKKSATQINVQFELMQLILAFLCGKPEQAWDHSSKGDSLYHPITQGEVKQWSVTRHCTIYMFTIAPNNDIHRSTLYTSFNYWTLQSFQCVWISEFLLYSLLWFLWC